MLNGRIPDNCEINVNGQATIMTKYPLPLDVLKSGKVVQIPIGVLIPEKKVLFEGESFLHNTAIKAGYITAEFIKRIKMKTVGSGRHHRFSYKVKKATIYGGEGFAA